MRSTPFRASVRVLATFAAATLVAARGGLVAHVAGALDEAVGQEAVAGRAEVRLRRVRRPRVRRPRMTVRGA